MYGNKDKKQDEAEENAPNTEEKIDEKQILKDYATSVMFALITKDKYILASSGQGGFVLFNAYEGRKLFADYDSEFKKENTGS